MTTINVTPDLVNVTLTKADINGLYNSGCKSFYYAQKDRFEILKGTQEDIPPDSYGWMMWYDSKLEALIAYNYYKPQCQAVLLSDTTDHGDYVVVLGKCYAHDNNFSVDGNEWLNE